MTQPSAKPPHEIAAAVARGERAAVAAALNLLERWQPGTAETDDVTALLGALPRDRLAGIAQDDCGHLIGVTGAPGVGKSSLVAALVRCLRDRGHRVGVLAIDPSSPRSGGALLGDRVRIARSSTEDDGLFVRSLACHGEQGGLSASAYPMVQVLLAAFDRVLVETVGVGQGEFDITGLADTTCLVLQPDSGDSVQFLKAGILELPELIVVNKADPPRSDSNDRAAQHRAERTAVELRASLGLPAAASDRQPIPVILASARAGYGIEAMVEALDRHLQQLRRNRQLVACRSRQASAWGVKRLLLEFGRFGIQQLGGVEHVCARFDGTTDAVERLEQVRRELLVRFGVRDEDARR